MSRSNSDDNDEVFPLPRTSVPPSNPISTPITVIPAGSSIARSPSHESLATDLSLMSLSSLGSEIGRIRSSMLRHRDGSGTDGGDSGDERSSPVIMEGAVGGWISRGARGGRPGNSSLLQVPTEQYGVKRGPADDVLYEEENEAIRNCGALSAMLGLMRSFSTSDLDQGVLQCADHEILRPSVSDMVLNSWKHYDLPYGRLEYTSRSCSTWVAVGDMSTTSQLPSPQTLSGYASEYPEMTAVDFVRAINKKVRQMYIRRRLESTYRALERLTRSELCLDIPPINIAGPSISKSNPTPDNNKTGDESKGATAQENNPPTASSSSALPQFHISTELDRCLRHKLRISSVGFRGDKKTLTLSVKDIERDKGKPLCKYDRNMMIFEWLQSLDEHTFENLS